MSESNDDIIAKLLPCPFCGAGEYQIRENGKFWTGMRYSDPVSMSIYHWCEPQGGQPSNFVERKGKTLDDAINNWNKRNDNNN